MKQDRTTRRLSAEAWERAGLGLIADAGLEAVAVEPLARALGVTKGSFYWHFSSRDALVEAALRRWRQESVEDVITEMERIAEPRARLLALVTLALRDPRHGRLEVALAASSDSPLVKRALAAALERRIAFLTALFLELGFKRRVAHRRAYTTYALFAGFYQLLRVAPGATKEARELARELVASLTVDAPAAGATKAT